MKDDFQVYMQYKNELDRFEKSYFELRKVAFNEKEIDKRINFLAELIEMSGRFEDFCKSVGLSRHLKEMYKQATTRNGKTNLFKEDRDEMKRCLLLKKLLKKMEKLSLNELQAVDEWITSLKKREFTGV